MNEYEALRTMDDSCLLLRYPSGWPLLLPAALPPALPRSRGSPHVTHPAPRAAAHPGAAPSGGLDAGTAYQGPAPSSGPGTAAFWGVPAAPASPRVGGAGPRGAEQAQAPSGRTSESHSPRLPSRRPAEAALCPNPSLSYCSAAMEPSRAGAGAGGRPDAFPGQEPQRGPRAACCPSRLGLGRGQVPKHPAAWPLNQRPLPARSPAPLQPANQPHCLALSHAELSPLPHHSSSTSCHPTLPCSSPSSYTIPATPQADPRRGPEASSPNRPPGNPCPPPPHQPWSQPWLGQELLSGLGLRWAVGASWPPLAICYMGVGTRVRCQALGTRQ